MKENAYDMLMEIANDVKAGKVIVKSCEIQTTGEFTEFPVPLHIKRKLVIEVEVYA